METNQIDDDKSSLKGRDQQTPIGRIALYFGGSRLLILLVSWLSLLVVNKGKYFWPKKTILDWFNCWDAAWYLRIATEGYQYEVDHASSVAFFPLYPLLVRLVGSLGIDPRVAGYLVSNVCLFVSCVLLWKLARRHYGRDEVADRAVLFLLFGPVSFFFSIIYSESLFLCFMLATLYFAGERRWLTAGVCGYFATLTRHVGLLLVVPLAIEYISANRAAMIQAGEWRTRLRRMERPFAALTALTLPLLGLTTYCGFLWVRFGEPLAFSQTQQFWDRHLTFFWQAFLHAPRDPFYRTWFIGTVAVALVLCILGFILRLRASHLVIGPIYLLLFVSTNSLESIPRYLSVLFPFYLTTALLVARWPRFEPLLLAATACLLTISTILFVNGYWFT